MSDACEQEVTRIARFLDLAPPQAPTVPEAVFTLLAMFDKAQNPLAALFGELEGQYQTVINAIHVLVNRLRGVAFCQTNTAATSLGAQELTAHTLELLHDIQERIEAGDRQIALMEADLAAMRRALESHDMQMHQFFRQEDIDLRQFSIREFMQRTNKFCDHITRPNTSGDYLHIHDIRELFSSVFPYFGFTAKSDPGRLIPDLCEKIISMVNSLNALQSFRGILTEARVLVDRDPDSMKAGFPGYEDLSEKISELNKCLKRISLVKVETIVFATLQRFVTLVSTLFAAIPGVHEAFVTRETAEDSDHSD